MKKASNGKTLVYQFVRDCGLANQIFEYAAAYGIAKKLGIPLELSWIPSKKREFELVHFGVPVPPHREGVPLVMNKVGQGNRAHVELAIRRITESKEKVVGISCPFQEESCFIDVADEIRELFKLEPIELPNPVNTTPIAVQVRRTDYVGHSRLDVCTPEYYLNAMEWMRQRYANPHFIVVSDDPFYCQRIFRTQLDVTVMPPQDSITGLRTIASCDAAVISNSTFGWWGAWLGENGPVCVPEIWHHKPGSYGDWKPAPDRWQRIRITGKDSRPVHEPVKIRTVMPKDPPKLDRAIVYPWHADQARWDELRYSLRSVEKFFEDKTCPIFIMGTRRPDWLNEFKHRVHYIGAFTYRQALEKGLQVAEKVLWMNDDIWFLKPSTWAECAVPRYLKEVGPEFLDKAETQTNPWRRGVIHVLKKLAEMGVTEQKVFSTHTPYVYEREKVLDVFAKFGVFEKFPLELALFHLHGKDPQPLGAMRTQELPFGDATWLNCADRHLTTEMKRALTELLPEPAPWEAAIRVK
jgi:hypothetical protein